MVEPLQEGDIINIREYKQGKSLVEVSRIKEIVKDIIAFSVTTNSRTELQCKIINSFKFLFDAQSPEKLETSVSEDKDKPSQVVVSESPSERVSKNPVGVSSSCKHTPSFNQNRLDGCAFCGYKRKT